MAVNDEHVEEFGLSAMVDKTFGNKVQAEQMPKSVMVGLLERAVSKYLSEEDREETRRRDAEAREKGTSPEWDHTAEFDAFWDEHNLDEVFAAYCSA